MTTHVTIVGVGLMGASLGAALKEAGGWSVTGVDVDLDRLKLIKEMGFLDTTEENFNEAVSSADIVVLATPISAIHQYLEDLKTMSSLNATIFDLGSTKRSVIEKMLELPENFDSIGGHPMTGKLTSNTEDLDAKLYRNKKFVIVKHPRTRQAAIDHAQRLLHDIGAIPVNMDAEEHDFAVSMISHLPHFMSIPLLSTTRELQDERVWSLAAGGYRKAASSVIDNPQMWGDIALDNADFIVKALNSYANQVAEFANLLQTANETTINALLEEARSTFKLHFD